jgi:predicted DsbA family dithiol-disulfide isomerase
VGKRNLCAAYEQLGGDASCPLRLEVTRRPYFLAPRMLGLTLDQSGRNRRWGARWSEDSAAENELLELGESVGYKFNPDAIMSDTMRSHRLILFAHKHGKGEEMAEALAQLYFEEGMPLCETTTLLEAARRVGGLPDRETVRRFLDSEEGQGEVLGQYLRVLELGIPSIPVAILTSGGEAATVHGSSSPQAFREALEKLIHHHASQPSDNDATERQPPHRLAALFDNVVPSATPLADVREAFEKDWQRQVEADGQTEERIRSRM